MDGMTAPAHAKPARRDHLWVLAVIATCALLEVWVSWVTIGSMSGFPKIGGNHGLPTAWTLAVTSEAYWGYALYAWLAGAPGPRSRRFAMGSFAAVFVLSLIGQAASHLVPQGTVPPPEVVVFITSLPVVVLALIAVLVHLRQLDREEAAEVDERRAVQAELETLRAELEAAREALAPLAAERDAAQRDLAEALTRAENFAQKLAAKSAQPKRSRAAQPDRKNAQADDITLEFRALDELQKDRGLRAPRMGAELGRRIGASPATGRRLHAKLTAQGRPGESLTERSADQSDERSGERS